MRNLFLREPEVKSPYDFTGSFTDMWRDMRVSLVMPPLTVAICMCVVMSIMMFIERVYMTVVILLVKFMGKKKYTQYKLEALKEDLEQNRSYPMVLVQIPSKLIDISSIDGHAVQLIWFAEGVLLEEIPCPLCILLCKEDNSTLGHLFLLLYSYPNKHHGSRSPSSKTNSHIYSSNNHHYRSLHLLVFWILFENVMSFHRSKATIIGLLGANRVNEWVVTEKLGNATKQKSNSRPSNRTRPRVFERLLFSELVMGLFLLYVACYDMIFGKDHMFIYLLLQSTAFFVVGVGYVGITAPTNGYRIRSFV